MNSVEFEIRARNNASGALKDASKDVRDLKSATEDGGQATKDSAKSQTEFNEKVRETSSALKGAREIGHSYSQLMSGQFLGAAISAAKGIKDLTVALMAMAGGAAVASIMAIAGALGALFLSGQSAKVKSEEVSAALAAVKNAADLAAESLAKANAVKLEEVRAEVSALADEWERARNAAKELQGAQDKLTNAKMGQEISGLGAEREAAMAGVAGDKDAERVTALEFDKREAEIRDRYAKEAADEAKRRAVGERSDIAVASRKSQEGASLVEAQARAAESDLANRKRGIGADVFDKSGAVDKSKLSSETTRVTQEIEEGLKQVKTAKDLEKRWSLVAYGELPASAGGGAAVMQSPAEKKAYTAAWEREVEQKQQQLGRLQSLPVSESAAADARKRADEAARQNTITQQNLSVKNDVAQTNIEAATISQRAASSRQTQTAAQFQNRRYALGSTIADESAQRAAQESADRQRKEREDAAYWNRADAFSASSQKQDAAAGAKIYGANLQRARVPKSIVSANMDNANALLGSGNEQATAMFAQLHAAWLQRDAKLMQQIQSMVRDLLKNNQNTTTHGP